MKLFFVIVVWFLLTLGVAKFFELIFRLVDGYFDWLEMRSQQRILEKWTGKKYRRRGEL